MSVACMTWVFTHSTAAGSDRLLLLAIADHAGDDGHNAWPSVPTLARKTGISERSVQRALARLEAGGHLVVERGRGSGGTNRYQVLMPLPAGDKLAPPKARKRPSTPRQSVTGDKTTPVTELRHPGGDTQVSPERPGTSTTNPPTPPASRGDDKRIPLDWTAGQCFRHRDKPGGNCKRCGTSPRQLAAAAAAAETRAAEAELADLVERRESLDWCGDPDCDRYERRLMTDRGLVKCPACHPDVVVGPLPRPALAVVPAPQPRRAAGPAF